MTRSSRLALAMCITLVASACSVSVGRLEFGIRRMALDLAFVDEDASPPADPRVVVRLIPAPPQVLAPDFDFDDLDDDFDFDPPPLSLCPPASPDQTIGLAAAPSIIEPPAPGTYLRRNTGFIEIQGTGLPLRLPYPFISAWEISEATEELRPGPFGTQGTLEPATQFTVTKSLGPEFSVTETYEIGGEALLLLERVTVASGVTTRFRTDPPVEFFHFGAEGDTWNSAGADTENGFGVLIGATISDREVIDVCGTLVDTFAIAYTEQVVNLTNTDSSGTNETEPSTIYLAPQFGGLVVREEIHTIHRTSAPDGSPLVILFDYVSTLMGIEPSDL